MTQSVECRHRRDGRRHVGRRGHETAATELACIRDGLESIEEQLMSIPGPRGTLLINIDDVDRCRQSKIATCHCFLS